MTVAYPIARGIAPMLAAAGAVLIFGENITFYTVIGIIIISLGILAVGVSHKIDRHTLFWPLMTGCCIAVYTVVDAQGVRAAPTAISYVVWTFLMLGFGIASVFAFWRGKQFILSAAQQWKPGLIAGSLSIVTYGLALLAFRRGTTPRLAALRETSILFATMIAVIFLKEVLTTSRMLGIAAIAIGAMILIIAG